jgi:hypothetical protein
MKGRKMSEKEKVEVSLKEFIDDNYKMLTVMGVLGAIIALFTRIDMFEGVEFLIVWCFVAFLVVNLELLKILYKTSLISWSLIVFGSSLGGILVGVSVYLLSNYWRQIFVLGIPILIFIPILYLLVYYTIRKRIEPKKERKYKLLALLLFFIIYIIVYAFLGSAGIL